MNITRAFRDRMMGALIADLTYLEYLAAGVVWEEGATSGDSTDLQNNPWSGRWFLAVTDQDGTDPTVQVNIQESATGSSGWTVIATSDTFDATTDLHSGTWTRTKRYLRSVVTVGGEDTPTVTGSVFVTEGGFAPFGVEEVKVGLYSALTNHGLGTLYADLTIPTLNPGNPQLIVSYSQAYNLAQSRLGANGTKLRFAPADADHAATVSGWFVSSAEDSPVLLAWEDFTAPIALPDAGKAVSVIFRPGVDPFSWFGSAFIIDH